MNQEVPGSSEPSVAGVETTLTEAPPAEGNLPFAIAAGAVAAIVGAAIWAAVTVATEYQIGWMAVGVGFLVGIAVRHFGKGTAQTYGIVAAVLALAGCVLGNFLTLVAFIGINEEVSFFATFGILDYAKIPSIMIETASPIDLLFYVLAISAGFKTGIVQTEAG